MEQSTPIVRLPVCAHDPRRTAAPRSLCLIDSYVHVSVYLFVYLSIYLSIYLPVYLSAAAPMPMLTYLLASKPRILGAPRCKMKREKALLRASRHQPNPFISSARSHPKRAIRDDCIRARLVRALSARVAILIVACRGGSAPTPSIARLSFHSVALPRYTILGYAASYLVVSAMALPWWQWCDWSWHSPSCRWQ